MRNSLKNYFEISPTACKYWLLQFCLLLFLQPVSAAKNFKEIQPLKPNQTAEKNDTGRILPMLNNEGKFDLNIRSLLDSSMYYLNHDVIHKEETGYNNRLYSIYDQLGLVFSRSGNYSISLDYYFKMLKILENHPGKNQNRVELNLKLSSLYMQIGTCYFNMDSNSNALQFYRKSLEMAQKISVHDNTYQIRKKLVMLYTNIGSVNLGLYKFEEAQINFEKALEINSTLSNMAYDASLYNDLGIIYKEKKDYTKAFHYFNKALEIRRTLKDTAGMIQTYNNIGDSYYLTGEYHLAIYVLNKAYEMSVQTLRLKSQIKAVNFLALTYEKVGDYALALKMQKLYNVLYDSIISYDKVQNNLRLEIKYKYEKQQKENEWQQKILLVKKERKTLIYIIISIFFLFFVVILFLFNRNQRKKMKQNALLSERLVLENTSLKLEKQNLLMEKQNLEMELELRNKELSTHMMYLLNKNEFISSIINKLLELKSLAKPENNEWIQDILREMNANVDNTVWTEFEMRFQKVHEDFYEKLHDRFPDLTPNEIKICAFLKLNMTTKDISAVTFQSVKSIQVARNRLRKKMGIEREENLISTIQAL